MFASKPTWSKIVQQNNHQRTYSATPSKVKGCGKGPVGQVKASNSPPISPTSAPGTNNGIHGTDTREKKSPDPPAEEKKRRVSATEYYADVQQNELDALSSIYGDDFVEVAGKPLAWNKTPDHAFRLRLKALSDEGTFTYLAVTMPNTYPKTVPQLSLVNAASLPENTRASIEDVLKTKPKTLLGSEMIFEIAMAIQDILEEAAEKKVRMKELPSLENERAVQAAASLQEAQQQEEQMAKKKEAENAEEERALGKLVEEELKRRHDKAKKPRRPTDTFSEYSKQEELLENALSQSPGFTTFERRIAYSAGGQVCSFRSVFGKAKINKRAPRGFPQGWSEVSIVQPVNALLADSAPLFALRHVIIGDKEGDKHDKETTEKVRSLEAELEKLKKLRHPNVLDPIEFKITRNPGASWDMYFLTDYANMGSLRRQLAVHSPFKASNVKAWMIQLLEATDFLHRNGIVHKSIHPDNILLTEDSSSNGEFSIKIADAYSYSMSHAFTNKPPSAASARSAYWSPPEFARNEGTRTAQSDIWDLGLVLLQMAFGVDILRTYASPTSLINSLDLSESFESIVREIFRSDPKRRPTAFDLLPFEFLRNDEPPLDQSETPTSAAIAVVPRSRHDSIPIGSNPSRYQNDFVEAGRLGRGGFGEVVKARNKLDGRFYAVKKITEKSKSALTDVLSEIMLLSRLNHPYVVRYFTAWIEEDFNQAQSNNEVAVSSTDSPSSVSDSDEEYDQDLELELAHSAGGLDFISSSGYPKIEFGYDSDEEEPSTESDGVISPGLQSRSGRSTGVRSPTRRSPKPQTRKSRSSSEAASTSTTLYIQMEYCEKKTMRDLIGQGLCENVEESWRLFRQILEGLAHIHSHGIIHRDLKPENIFIDVSNAPRIGDFGLATSGQFSVDKTSSLAIMGDSLTHSIGTTFYVAPELRSSAGMQYNQKVDMYSLGIIFFEMCYPLKTGMERDQILRDLREPEHTLPSDFSSSDKGAQGDIILSLLNHKPNERPSSAELLRSGIVPTQMEDETVRLALERLSNPDSPYYQQMMAALFERPSKKVQDFAWDARSVHKTTPHELFLQGMVKDKLISIFRHHGAVQGRRQMLFPKSDYYPSSVVRLLDSSSTLVQLPYDLTLPNARAIAKGEVTPDKSFCFGTVFREALNGCQPRSHREVDFDVVSHDTLDLALREAEVIKVLDEIINEFPSLRSSPMCFHINHSDLLDIIMDFCRISGAQRSIAKDIVGKLNVGQWTWQKIRNELRSPPLAISTTSLDDLIRFDFRDRPDKAHQKLKGIFDDSELSARLDAIFTHLNAVTTYLKRMGVKRKVYVNPLSSFNEKFYRGGFIFQCVSDTKKRDVFAAGGRYDRLIKDFQLQTTDRKSEYHAVGFNLGWDKLCTSMARYMKTPPKKFLKKSEVETQGAWASKRCDVLVASLDPNLLRTAGLEVMQELWTNGISAELAIDASSHEELMSHYKDDPHSWVVILRHDPGSNMVDRTLKIKTMTEKTPDLDVRMSDLVSWIRAQIGARDHKDATGSGVVTMPRMTRLPSHHDSFSAGPSNEKGADVRVLQAQHRSKKINRRNIVESAQQRAQELSQELLDGPIAAIETTDRVLEAIRDTRLSDPESWRKVCQDAPLVDRKYLMQVQELLEEMRDKEGARNAFIYNFRTGSCICYDLGSLKI
ncbi:MAG: hypothetical protein M1834_000187 [Cirrosporium novae-zelandiae]|nr:MAG: hypothetical protein M1834_000187 [Cirrosporium novae-zelandiae]